MAWGWTRGWRLEARSSYNVINNYTVSDGSLYQVNCIEGESATAKPMGFASHAI